MIKKGLLSLALLLLLFSLSHAETIVVQETVSRSKSMTHITTKFFSDVTTCKDDLKAGPEIGQMFGIRGEDFVVNSKSCEEYEKDFYLIYARDYHRDAIILVGGAGSFSTYRASDISQALDWCQNAARRAEKSYFEETGQQMLFDCVPSGNFFSPRD